MCLRISLLGVSLLALLASPAVATTVVSVRDGDGACGLEVEAVYPPSDWHQHRRPSVTEARIRGLPAADGRGNGI
jgi:hypothetical protein